MLTLTASERAEFNAARLDAITAVAKEMIEVSDSTNLASACRQAVHVYGTHEDTRHYAKWVAARFPLLAKKIDSKSFAVSLAVAKRTQRPIATRTKKIAPIAVQGAANGIHQEEKVFTLSFAPIFASAA